VTSIRASGQVGPIILLFSH